MVYLDYNSTTPIDERVLDEMIKVYRNVIGNPDSRTHLFGDEARQVVEQSRSKIAALLNINKDEVFFTSGATESNNIAIQGLKEYAHKTGKKHIVTTNIEHKAILETCKAMVKNGFEVSYVNPRIDGRILFDEVKNLVRDDTLLVTVMHVNNETGIIQPVKEIGDYLADKEVYFHIDATQSFGKLVDELKEIKFDTLSVSAHKIGGPQGIGALILKKKHYRLPPVKGIMYGGQQEHGIRPGTIPVALVAGFGAACSFAFSEYKSNMERCKVIKEALLEELEIRNISYKINGNSKYCMPNILNIYFEGVSSEALMLSTKHYCGVSNGSACNSNSYKPSYVLLAMGLPVERIENSIRISWGAKSEIKDIIESFAKLLTVVKNLKL